MVDSKENDKSDVRDDDNMAKNAGGGGKWAWQN